MIPLLLESLKKKLTEGLREMALVHHSKDGDKTGPPYVWVGDLPPKRDPKDFSGLPCVLLVPLASYIDNGMGEVDIALICVIYNPEKGDAMGAECDLANVLSRVRGLLIDALESKGRPLDGRFVLVPDQHGNVLAWQKSDQQTRPFIQATMSSVWQYKDLE